MVQTIRRSLIGELIGQYRIIDTVGQGGVATIYRAQQLNIEREVAIKIMMVDDPKLIQSLEREAQTIAQLRHPHILKLFDFGRYEDMAYLVMELVTGGSLADMMHNGPLAPDVVSSVLDQVAAALDCAHEQGIVHRDLKPHNILRDNYGNVLLSDFGLAWWTRLTPNSKSPSVIIGTPFYMAPEQWRGGSLDASVDIYALGVMAFEMLTGQLPFKAETPFQLMHMHLYEQPPHLQEIDPRLPKRMDAVVRRALDKEPERRFKTAGEMATAFRNALPDMAETSTVKKSERLTQITGSFGAITAGLMSQRLLNGGRRQYFTFLFAILVIVLAAAIFIAPQFIHAGKNAHDQLWSLASDVLPGINSSAFSAPELILPTPSSTAVMLAVPTEVTVTATFTPTPQATSTPVHTKTAEASPQGVLPSGGCIPVRGHRC